MPKQKGIVKIEGTIDDLTFYQSQDGSLVRKKTSVDKDRITNDPSFLRTRENNAEFKNASNASKLVVDVLRKMSSQSTDGRAFSRQLKIMMAVKKYDTVSDRGLRTVLNGMTDPAARELLDDFDANKHAPLSSIIKSEFTLDESSGTITFPDFIPQKGVMYPDGATHLVLQSGFARLDFVNNEYELKLSPESNMLIDKVSSNVTLKPVAVPTLAGTSLYILRIFFYQEVNGKQYELQNDANSSMAIIAVS